MCEHCKHNGPDGFAIPDTSGEVDIARDIEDFHIRFHLPAHSEPRGLEGDMAKFRLARLQEEVREYEEALCDEDTEGQLDALVDLVYIAIGTAYISGFRFTEAHRRVHRANMDKIRAAKADDSRHGTTYDVVKPEGWKPCDLRNLCETYWRIFYSSGQDETILATGKGDAINKAVAYSALSKNTQIVRVEQV